MFIWSLWTQDSSYGSHIINTPMALKTGMPNSGLEKQYVCKMIEETVNGCARIYENCFSSDEMRYAVIWIFGLFKNSGGMNPNMFEFGSEFLMFDLELKAKLGIFGVVPPLPLRHVLKTPLLQCPCHRDWVKKTAPLVFLGIFRGKCLLIKKFPNRKGFN